jgi:hypothetical protein
MNDRELRLECVRIASGNLQCLLSASGLVSSQLSQDDMALRVAADAEKLYHYVWDGPTLKVAA